VEKVKLTKLPMACLIASTTHQDKEWSIAIIGADDGKFIHFGSDNNMTKDQFKSLPTV
jgi:hypothetical protein